MLVLRHRDRKLFDQRYRQDLGNRNAIMDGMGSSRSIMLVVGSLHLLHHEEVRISYERMLIS